MNTREHLPPVPGSAGVSEIDEYLRRYYDPTIRGRVQLLAERTGRSRQWIRQRAHRLGLTVIEKRYWSREELNFLEDWAGRRSLEWIARQLNRSHGSVRKKLQDMGISARARDSWYSPGSLAECFGCSKSTVENWISQGRLAAERRGCRWCITDEAVRRFIRDNPEAWPMRTADQLWFTTLVLGLPGRGLE